MIRLTTGEHAGAALVTVALCLLLPWAARRRPGAWTHLVARALAILLVANLAFWEIATASAGSLTGANGLLLDVCPVTAAVAAAALWTRQPLLIELAYFWACTGVVMGVISPDAYYHFPSPFYFQFYITHSGAVIAAVFLVFGLRHTPRPGLLARVVPSTLALIAIAGIADVLTGANYVFLRDRRATGTLGDLLGPWPWYLMVGFILWVGSMWVLSLPFNRVRWRSATSPVSRLGSVWHRWTSSPRRTTTPLPGEFWPELADSGDHLEESLSPVGVQ